MAHPFYLVDVFAESKYAGNQLVVVRNAADLSALDMQKIAAEMNYSETAFLLSDELRDGGYDVRIFSLDEELPFAGHPTLGTAYIIQQQVIGKDVAEVKLNLKAGQIPVTFSYIDGKPGQLWMRQIAPTFGRTFSPEDVARALNLNDSSIDQSFPIEEVSTGLPFIIVPLKDLEAVKNCSVDRVGYMKLIDQAEAKSVFVFCPECYDPNNQINGRMFDDYHGIAEDPATGSANGCLAAYLVKNRYYGTTEIDIKVEQGYEIGRPSLLLLKAQEQEDGAIAVSVGGTVIMVAGGELV
jgi:trans-2,3-dihydro-3-hydroxyanthranilate isomerase